MNKIGTISNTITWFFVTIFVFFLLIVYFFFIGIGVVSKGTFSESDYDLKIKGVNDEAVQREFVNFLTSKTEFNGENIKVYELIADKNLAGNETYFEEFNRLSGLFLYSFYKDKKIAFFSEENNFYPTYSYSFIRIYNSSEVVESSFKGKIYNGGFEKYDFAYSKQTPDGLLDFPICESLEDNLLVEVIISKDKKIALCMEYQQ